VVAFSELEERLRAEQVLREHDAVLARQEASLRRIATLVAAGAASAEVFAVIAREVAQMLELPIVLILRYETDQTVSVLADWSEQPHRFQTGTCTRWPLDGPSVSALVAAPIVVDGTLWGSIATGQIGRGTLPTQIEERLAEFTDLVATAISNSSNREELARLAAEQTTLRRVATLVAQAVPPADLFSAVSEPSSDEYPPPADVALVQAAVIRPKRPFGSEMRRIATAPVYGSFPYKCTVDSHAKLGMKGTLAVT
jgi:GAF domain-containing protein